MNAVGREPRVYFDFYSELVQHLCLGLVIEVLGCVQNHPSLLHQYKEN